MLKLKNDPVSIDALIQTVQRRLYTKLNAAWGLTEEAKKLDAYGRVYINDTTGGKIAEDFVKGTDYTKTLLTADKSKFFFIKDPVSKKDGNRYTTTVELCFLVDLKKLKPALLHRADEEVHADVENELKFFAGYKVYIESYTTGINNVFRGLEFNYKDDIQPRHAFKFTLKMEYKIDQEDCII